MPSPFEPFLLENGLVVLDGGLATELETQGADLTGELWSAAILAENPSLIRDTHLAYYRAGADVATTASYQASFEGFLRKGYDRERAKELLLLSVKLAVEARDQFWVEHQRRSTSPATTLRPSKPRTPLQLPPSKTTKPPPPPTTTAAGAKNPQQQLRGGDGKRHDRRRPLVAASVGCYGAALADGSEYRGEYGETVGQQGLRDWHKERLDILAGADGVDLVMFETIPCLAEVRAILSLLEDLHPRVSAVISISCQDGQHLRSGERVQEFADLIWRHTEDHGGEGTGESAATPTCVGTPSQVDGLGAPVTNDFFPTSPRSSMHSAPTMPAQEVPVPSSVGDRGISHRSVYDQEQQEIRRGLEDLLARPPPSFDYMMPDRHGRHDRDSPLHRARDIPASGTLPELLLPRSGHRNGSGSEVTPALDEVRRKHSREGQRRGSGSTAAGPTVKSSTTSRRMKPTRSQSGGHLRPGESTGGATAVRCRESASSAGAGPSKHTTAVKAFEGADAVLLEEAFAFAERSAKEEEEAERQESLAPREGRKPRRGGRGLDLVVQPHRGEKGGPIRRTSGNGGQVAGVGAGGRIEVEDWVRGLPGSSPQALSQRQLKHQQSASSINQAPHHGDRPGAAGREQQARGRRRGKLTVGIGKKEAREEAGTLRFDRRRETEEKKRATATVELVERFENGTGVSELRAELEESQAAMRRSAEAFQQVASQWRQQRLMLPPPGGDR
eukprot:g6280.t1